MRRSPIKELGDDGVCSAIVFLVYMAKADGYSGNNIIA